MWIRWYLYAIVKHQDPTLILQRWIDSGCLSGYDGVTCLKESRHVCVPRIQYMCVPSVYLCVPIIICDDTYMFLPQVVLLHMELRYRQSKQSFQWHFLNPAPFWGCSLCGQWRNHPKVICSSQPFWAFAMVFSMRCVKLESQKTTNKKPWVFVHARWTAKSNL